MKALVTGGTGFVGSNIIRHLLGFHVEVLCTGREGEQNSECRCVGYDFSELDWDSIGHVDVVFHQAAIADTTVYDEQLMLETNVLKSMKLFQQAFDRGCRRFVYASSCAVYGDVPAPFVEDGPKNPLNIYGVSKLRLDEEAIAWGKANDVTMVGLRYSNVYGPGETHKGKTMCMVSQIGNQMVAGKRPKLFKFGEQKRDFVYVKDIAYYNVMASEFAGQDVFNAGSGIDCTFNDIVSEFNEYLQTDIEPEYIDNPYSGKFQNHTLCDMTKTFSVLAPGEPWTIRQAIRDYFLAE